MNLILQNCLPETLIGEKALLSSQFENYVEVHSDYFSIASDKDCETLEMDIKQSV